MFRLKVTLDLLCKCILLVVEVVVMLLLALVVECVIAGFNSGAIGFLVQSICAEISSFLRVWMG